MDSSYPESSMASVHAPPSSSENRYYDYPVPGLCYNKLGSCIKPAVAFCKGCLMVGVSTQGSFYMDLFLQTTLRSLALLVNDYFKGGTFVIQPHSTASYSQANHLLITYSIAPKTARLRTELGTKTFARMLNQLKKTDAQNTNFQQTETYWRLDSTQDFHRCTRRLCGARRQHLIF